MTPSAILDILAGNRLGPQPSSELSRLLVQARNLGTALHLVEKTRKDSLALRLGGTCKHGADKGPRCALCLTPPSTMLQGDYVSAPPGLEWCDYQINLLARSTGKSYVKLTMQCDRIEDTLKEIDYHVKVSKRLTDKASVTAPEPLTTFRLDEVKKSAKVDQSLLSTAVEVAEERPPLHARIQCGDLCVIIEPVPSTCDTLADLGHVLARTVHSMSGRRLVPPIRFSSGRVMLPEDASLDELDSLQRLSLTNPVAEHDAPLLCYQAMERGSCPSSALSQLLGESTHDKVCLDYFDFGALLHQQQQQQQSLFSSLCFSATLMSLSLRGVQGLPLDLLFGTLKTLPSLAHLDVSYSLEDSPVVFLSRLADLSEMTALSSLDLSGNSLLGAQEALAAVIVSLPITRLALNACVRGGDTAGGRQQTNDFCKAFGLALRALNQTMLGLEFEANVLADSQDTRSLFLWMFQRCVEVSLCATGVEANDGFERALAAGFAIAAPRLQVLKLNECDGGVVEVPSHLIPELRVIEGGMVKRLRRAVD